MIKQAIIPLAGLGTRLLPITSVLPKELLPINGKPGLEYILDECLEAGIKQIILVISSRKKIIKKYFYNDIFFQKNIKKMKNDKRLKIVKLGANKIDYIETLDINKLVKPYKKNNKYKIFIAYYLGSTRLIDNI